MLQIIQRILKSQSQVSAWIIQQKSSQTQELFCIGKSIDMNRACQTLEFSVRVFVDFEEENIRFKGDSTVIITPMDDETEVAQKIQSAVFSAGFVKNPWYDLPSCEGKPQALHSYDTISDFKQHFNALFNIFYKDYGYQAQVNCTEFFAVQHSIRLLTSKGVDVSYNTSEFSFELVTDCNTGKEPVEIFNIYTFTNINLAHIESIVQKQLFETQMRAKATPNPTLSNVRVILSGDAVEELLSFYLEQALDKSVFQKSSRFALNEPVNAQGALQKLNIRINPFLANAITAKPVDEEGKILKAYPLVEDNILKNYITTARFSHYLGVPHVGHSMVFEVEGGNQPLDHYIKDDYIEILAFSSFLMDSTTGDFGGEFRLAKWVKNGETTYITGGSISENIFASQNTMLFSKELEERTHSLSPKAIIFDGITVTGK